ncbi:hypothetical protein STEG23_005801, partial [Scotinomys teguina]
MTVTPLGWDQDCSLKIREPEVPAPWFLDPGGWSKTAAVSLYFIFPGICTLSLNATATQETPEAVPPGHRPGSQPGLAQVEFQYFIFSSANAMVLKTGEEGGKTGLVQNKKSQGELGQGEFAPSKPDQEELPQSSLAQEATGRVEEREHKEEEMAGGCAGDDSSGPVNKGIHSEGGHCRLGNLRFGMMRNSPFSQGSCAN